MKEFFKTVLVGVLIAFVLFLIQVLVNFLNGNVIDFDASLLLIFTYHLLYSISLTLVNSYYFDFISAKFSDVKYGAKRIIYGALGSIVLTTIVLHVINVFIFVSIEGQSYLAYSITSHSSFYIIGIFITLFITLLFHTIEFYKLIQQNKVKEQQLIAGNASARFDALKNQLDPHFLFNSLNVLTSLIEENPKNAQRFTTALSKIYRYVLEQKNKDLIPLDEELEFARTYTLLLKMRFEDSVIFNIPESAMRASFKVVPLSLQLLLENAVKHNVVSTNKPLYITIEATQTYLTVINNLQPKAILKQAGGVGLNNIKERYRILTEKPVLIHKSESEFKVSIPVLN